MGLGHEETPSSHRELITFKNPVETQVTKEIVNRVCIPIARHPCTFQVNTRRSCRPGVEKKKKLVFFDYSNQTKQQIPIIVVLSLPPRQKPVGGWGSK